MAASIVDDKLWREFHELVNMTSRELRDWLATAAAHEHSEELPDRAGTSVGRHVLAILGKRRTDLTEDDAEVMRHVIRRIRALLEGAHQAAAANAHHRHSTMSLGHDPLKPST
jgi:hypothetical protein